MWEKHCRAERAVHEARVANAKATKALAQANLSVPRTSHLHMDDRSDGFSSMASSALGLATPGGEHAGSSSGSDAESDAGSHRGSRAGSDVTAASSERDDESVRNAFNLDDTAGDHTNQGAHAMASAAQDQDDTVGETSHGHQSSV
jgi:hypothetical protein